MNKNNIYGLNIHSQNILLKKFGFKSNKSILNLEEINTFWNLNGLKKDVCLKLLFLKKKSLITSGSYKGYKKVRGLPVNNQRVKTNAKTTRKLFS